MTDAPSRHAAFDADWRVEPLASSVDPVLYATCLHEYAHRAVACHFGAFGFVTVRRLRAAASGKPGWQGRFQLFGALDDDEWRIVAIAGTLAERLYAGLPADAAVLESALRLPGALSDCDAALAGDFVREDVARCAVVLREQWAAISREAWERLAEISDPAASAP